MQFMVLGLLLLSLHPHQFSHFQVFRIIYCMLILKVKVTTGIEILKSRELLGCPVLLGTLG